MSRAVTGFIIMLSIMTDGMALEPEKNWKPLYDLPFTTIDISGTVIDPPPCKINNDKPVDVDFDILMIQLLDGERYKKTVPTEITCPDTMKGEVSLQVQGNSSDFDYQLLKTNKKGLAIKFILKGKPLAINKFTTIDWRSNTVLEAIPVAEQSNPPAAGNFAATAILLLMLN